jgi:prevent-host-death family protein
MEQISIREVNQRFSHFLAKVEQGEEVIITRRGTPVAKLSPIKAQREITDEQQAAFERSLARMKKGYPLGGKKFDRELIHER